MTGASRRIIQPALCAGRAVLTNTSVPCQRRRLRPASLNRGGLARGRR